MIRLSLLNVTAAGRTRRVFTAAAAGAALCLAGFAATGTAGATSTAGAAAPALLPPPQSALQQVTGFGPNPTGLQMYLYVPRHVRPRPAVVVALHYCTGSGPAMFARTEFASLADRYGFIVVYPSAPGNGQCFDIASPGALTHDGDGDPAGIVSMVRWAEQHLNADPHRVFAAGISNGAIMTNVLLADYPGVFRAGSAMSGAPYRCFGTSNGPDWFSECVNGTIIKTPQEWGDLARAADPAYHGPRPRMQLWHGTADAVLAYPNFGEEIKEWASVTGARLAHTDKPLPTWTHSVYAGQSGQVAVDAYSVASEDHDLGFHFPGWAQYAVAFFGLARGHGHGGMPRPGC